MSDICQTPGCGHAPFDHHVTLGEGRCGFCPCTRYTAPKSKSLDDLCPCGQTYAVCPIHFLQVRPIGEVVDEMLTAPHEPGQQPTPRKPTREQVLADAQQAWAKWGVTRSTGAEALAGQPGFIAGYLSAKGIDHE